MIHYLNFLGKKQMLRQRGATLIEVLVAIFLLTIGLLAMASLTTSAAGYNKLSQIRGTATMLANDYSDQARANLRAFDVGSYAITTSPTQPSNTLPDSSADYSTVGTLQSAKDVAAWDRYRWVQSIANRLPAGTAVVNTSTAAVGDSDMRMMEIWIKWKEPGTGFDIAASSSSEFAKCDPGNSDPAFSCLYFKVAI